MDRRKQFEDLREIRDKILVFGGVYSNLQALEAMKVLAEKAMIGPSNIICTGDVVAYCAQPEESVQLMKEWGVHCIAGNVEIQLREGAANCGCNFEGGTTCDVLSNRWYPYAQSKLSKDSIDWMKTLPDFIRFKFNGQKGLVLHGSLDETAEYIFKSTSSFKKDDILNQAEADIILAGHSGLPFVDIIGSRKWINAGVIGMPANDSTTDVWYVLLESAEEGTVIKHERLKFDHKKAAKLIKQNNLPNQYSDTLKTGIWDNCDILPPQETSLQGVKIEL